MENPAVENTAAPSTAPAAEPAGSGTETAAVPSTATSAKPEKREITLLERLEDRLSYANQVLSNFEALRHNALFTKVPKPYQKRWQVDSGLFFVMAVRTRTRLLKHKAQKKG